MHKGALQAQRQSKTAINPLLLLFSCKWSIHLIAVYRQRRSKQFHERYNICIHQPLVFTKPALQLHHIIPHTEVKWASPHSPVLSTQPLSSNPLSSCHTNKFQFHRFNSILPQLKLKKKALSVTSKPDNPHTILPFLLSLPPPYSPPPKTTPTAQHKTQTQSVLPSLPSKLYSPPTTTSSSPPTLLVNKDFK